MKALPSKRVRVAALLLVAGVIAAMGWNRIATTYQAARWYLPYWMAKKERVHDEAGVLRQSERDEWEHILAWDFVESDVDIHLAFVPDTDGLSPEEFTSRAMNRWGVGDGSGGRRGLLLLYDQESRHLRVEVGYDLEPYFPDSFIHQLVEGHSATLFEGRQLEFAIQGLLLPVQSRIRRAALGRHWDPKAVEALDERRFRSGGAGGGTQADLGPEKQRIEKGRLPDAIRAQLVPGKTPDETYERFLTWLAQDVIDPDVELLLPNSRSYVRGGPFTPTYFQFWFVFEHGRGYEIDERDDLALLYFTDDPFLSPHFLRRVNGLWYFDLFAEIVATHQFGGGPYSWCYLKNDTEYDSVFMDRWIHIGACERIIGGDNRPIPTGRPWS